MPATSWREDTFLSGERSNSEGSETTDDEGNGDDGPKEEAMGQGKEDVADA